MREQVQGKVKANVEGTNIHYDPRMGLMTDFNVFCSECKNAVTANVGDSIVNNSYI